MFKRNPNFLINVSIIFQFFTLVWSRENYDSSRRQESKTNGLDYLITETDFGFSAINNNNKDFTRRFYYMVEPMEHINHLVNNIEHNKAFYKFKSLKKSNKKLSDEIQNLTEICELLSTCKEKGFGDSYLNRCFTTIKDSEDVSANIRTRAENYYIDSNIYKIVCNYTKTLKKLYRLKVNDCIEHFNKKKSADVAKLKMNEKSLKELLINFNKSVLEEFERLELVKNEAKNVLEEFAILRVKGNSMNVIKPPYEYIGSGLTKNEFEVKLLYKSINTFTIIPLSEAIKKLEIKTPEYELTWKLYVIHKLLSNLVKLKERDNSILNIKKSHLVFVTDIHTPEWNHEVIVITSTFKEKLLASIQSITSYMRMPVRPKVANIELDQSYLFETEAFEFAVFVIEFITETPFEPDTNTDKDILSATKSICKEPASQLDYCTYFSQFINHILDIALKDPTDLSLIYDEFIKHFLSSTKDNVSEIGENANQSKRLAFFTNNNEHAAGNRFLEELFKRESAMCKAKVEQKHAENEKIVLNDPELNAAILSRCNDIDTTTHEGKTQLITCYKTAIHDKYYQDCMDPFFTSEGLLFVDAHYGKSETFKPLYGFSGERIEKYFQSKSLTFSFSDLYEL